LAEIKRENEQSERKRNLLPTLKETAAAEMADNWTKM
jgi:hypothetical protein